MCVKKSQVSQVFVLCKMKGHFHDPSILILSFYKFITKVPVNSEVAFWSACFTVSYCCIGHFGWYLLCRHDKWIMWRIFRQTNEFARNILHTYIMYLKPSTDVKISIFLEKNGGMIDPVDHKMDFQTSSNTYDYFLLLQGLGCVLYMLCFGVHPFEDSAKLRIFFLCVWGGVGVCV